MKERLRRLLIWLLERLEVPLGWLRKVWNTPCVLLRKCRRCLRNLLLFLSLLLNVAAVVKAYNWVFTATCRGGHFISSPLTNAPQMLRGFAYALPSS